MTGERRGWYADGTNFDPGVGCGCNAGNIKRKKKAGKRLGVLQGAHFLGMREQGSKEF